MTDAEYTKQARKELGMTQTAFAKAFHFTDQQHVSKVERGELELTPLRREFISLKSESLNN